MPTTTASVPARKNGANPSVVLGEWFIRMLLAESMSSLVGQRILTGPERLRAPHFDGPPCTPEYGCSLPRRKYERVFSTANAVTRRILLQPVPPIHQRRSVPFAG
jgi:hypothetical protein